MELSFTFVLKMSVLLVRDSRYKFFRPFYWKMKGPWVDDYYKLGNKLIKGMSEKK